MDHSDHRAVASLVERAHIRYTAPHTFISYIDYIDLFYPPNVFSADFVAKEKAFSAYAVYAGCLAVKSAVGIGRARMRVVLALLAMEVGPAVIIAAAVLGAEALL